MKVVRVETSRLSVPRAGVLIRLVDEFGRWGSGGALPLAGYSSESLPEVEGALSKISNHLPLDIEPDAASIDEALAALFEGSRGPPSARHAVSMALLELAAQTRIVPMVHLFRGDAPRGVFARCALITASEPAWAVAQARTEVDAGAVALKVKVGRLPHARDLDLVRSLRKQFPRTEVRLDANGVWSVDEAREKMQAFQENLPSFVEEPVRGDLLLSLRDAPFSWAADESLAGGWAEEFAACPSCVAFVLKPMRLGGVLECLRLARIARSAGKGIVVTHMFDGVHGTRACRLLLEALPDPVLASAWTMPVEACSKRAGFLLPHLSTEDVERTSSLAS